MFSPKSWPLSVFADESALVREAQRNPSAFAPLYERYFPRIYAYCLRRVASAQEAEDLASVIFTRALLGLETYQGGSFAAWLFTIAHHAVVSAYRSRPLLAPLELAEALPAPADDPLSHVLRLEEQAHLRLALAQLSAEQRDLLALRLEGELSAQDIGSILGKSAGAVRVDLHRTLKTLRRALKRQEG